MEVSTEKKDPLSSIDTSNTQIKEEKIEKVDTSNETVPDWLK
jgi:hypothetical protein